MVKFRNQKNTVLTIIPSLYNGGAEKFTADLSRHLSKNFNLTTTIYNTTETLYQYSGKLIDLKEPEALGFLKKINRQIAIKKKIKTLKKDHSFSVSVSHMLMANMLNILTTKHEKTVCVIHGEWSIKSGKGKILDFFIKRIYKKADVIVSVSNFIKQKFDNYYSLKIPHKVIYAGVDTERIVALANQKQDFNLPENYLVYIAGFRAVKNHLLLLESIKDFLKKNEISLVLIGDGPFKLEAENFVEKEQLNNKVLFLGNLANPYPVLKNAKLSLLVSSSESFSLAVVESMVLGVPTLSTDCGGPKEIIAPFYKDSIKKEIKTEFGVLIPHPSNWEKDTLVTSIKNMLEDQSLLKSLSIKGVERAKDFSIEASTEAYKELLLNLIEDK